MTTKEQREIIRPFISRCDKDGDPYLLVHFSRENDYFEGTHNGLDFLDAIMVIKELVKIFGINKEVLIESL